MAFDFIETDDAIAASGLRMTLVSQVPSPWGEAAKGILHIKGLEWSAVRLDVRNEAQCAWAGHDTAPAAVLNDEPGKARWNDLLFLFERLQPQPSLLPIDPMDRALMLGLCHEILGEQGLATLRRVVMVDAGLQGKGGFITPVADYLAAKYGHSADLASLARARVAQILAMLGERLDHQRKAGSAFFIGDRVSALDVYSAAAMAMFRPLSEDLCPMKETTRAAFETKDESDQALPPIVLEHRDMMYREYLELPIAL
ncbi:MAG: hypothetical protein AAF511_05940 [Pseudomonadota bacterium]